MTNKVRIENIAEHSVKFWANTDNAVCETLKKDGIHFEENLTQTKGVCLITVPAKTIIEVLDGDITQQELRPVYKGKLIKDKTKETAFLVDSKKATLQKEIKDLQDLKAKLEGEIKDLQKGTEKQ